MKSVFVFFLITLNFQSFSSSFDILIDLRPLRILENGCYELIFVNEQTSACYRGSSSSLVRFMNNQECKWGDGVFMNAQFLTDEKISYVHYHLGGVEPAVILEKCQD